MPIRLTSSRYYQYLRERFPLKEFVILALLLAISAGAGVQIYIYKHFLSTRSLFLSFLALFLFFLRLRLFDEFKDFSHDSQYYPNRPVQRGIITLKELARAVFVVLLFEMLIAIKSGFAPLWFFLIAFAYSLLMFKEFFVSRWLRNHFTVYIISHEILVFPLFLYIFSINGFNPSFFSVAYFLYLTLFLGSQLFLLEVARKIRAPDLETPARDTYTSQYGVAGASILIILLSSMALSCGFFAEISASGRTAYFICPSLLALIILAISTFHFKQKPLHINAKKVFNSAALFVLLVDVAFILSILRKP